MLFLYRILIKLAPTFKYMSTISVIGAVVMLP